jgi:hypothetical protein
MRERLGLDTVTLDSFIISETASQTLRRKWPDNWSRRTLQRSTSSSSHSSWEYDYLAEMMTEKIRRNSTRLDRRETESSAIW